MKNLFSSIIPPLKGRLGGVLFTLLATTTLYAYDFKSGDLYYNITSDTTVEVTYQEQWPSSNYFGLTTASIPETVTYNGTTYSVISIGDEAFNSCSSLTSVTIPNSVTSIEGRAFGGCTSLTSVTIPNSVTSIEGRAFGYCDSLTSITIPNSVTSIGDAAFAGCYSLTKTNYTGDIASWCDIKFGSSDANPIYHSKNLYINNQEIKDLVIPNSVDSIHNYTFCNYSSLISVTLPESITSIGDGAFNTCSSLTSVTIPNSVTSIGATAFYWCSSLTSVTIGKSVTSIGDRVFGYCSSLNSVAIGENVTSIGYEAFVFCTSLTTVTIPNRVTSIGELAFCNCSSLTSVTISDSITNIGENAFWDCSSLTSITIPNSVTNIGENAFYGCRFTRDNFVNNSTLDAEANNYWGAEFVDTDIDGLLIRNDTVINCRKFVTSVSIPESVTSIGKSAFSGCSSLTSITIPNSVTSIGEKAFGRCFSLTSITIPNSVTSISKSSFLDCSSLTFITIPNSVTSIGESAFSGCSSLTSITIPNSVTSIGSRAFSGCSSLTSITIPNSVTSIGDGAFGGCTSLPIENNLRYADTYLVRAVDKTLSTYSIKEGTKWIGNNAFSDCSSLTFITIPNSVTSIGSTAFYDCSSLTSITIPNSVTSIGSRTFYDCSSLTSITIPSSVTSIGYGAFSGCSSLTSITIPNSVTSIGESAFSGCSSLTSITIPNSVTSIGNDAFSGCSALTYITCEATTPPTVEKYAFYGISTSIPVYVPCGCVSAYKAASTWKDFTKIQEPQAEYSIQVDTSNSQMGTAKVDYNTFCEGSQITATANYGYHFVQWSDGVTDNPRTLILTQDTVLTAEFALTTAGQCGDNLYWIYDEGDQSVSITGSGEMYDYTSETQPWLLFKEQIMKVTTSNTATSIGTSAFEGCVGLKEVTLGSSIINIAANAFAGCNRLYHIYCYPTYPPMVDQSSFSNYNVYLHVLCDYKEGYDLDIVWGDFKYIECMGAESEPINPDTVIVISGTNDVTITWPTEGNADTYTIIIKRGSEVFCTLTFNADGQLLNIAFAPSRDGKNHPAQYAVQTVSGYRFTVTGLEEGTHYTYNIDVRDIANKIINSHAGEFTTQSTTAVDNIQSPITNCQKIISNGQLIILRDGKTYTAMGAEIQ